MVRFTFNYFVMNTCLIVYGILAVFPPATTLFNSTLVSLICLACWIVVSMLTDINYYNSLRNIYPLLFIAVTFIMPYMLGSSVIGNRYINLSMIPLGVLIFDFYKKNRRIKNLKIIALVISFFALITFVITLSALIKDPYISRSIKSSGEYSADLARKGIGGYSFIYFIAISSQFLLYIFFKTSKRAWKAVTLAGYLLSLLFVLKSNYMTALIISVLASVILFLFHYAHADFGKKIALSFILLALILLILNLNEIIQRFSHAIPKRILEAITVNEGQNILSSIWDEFILDRWPTMKESIDAFLKYPLFGLVGAGNVYAYDGGVVGFGQHSHILDTFSLYGIAIGLFNLLIIFRPLNKKRLNNGSEALRASMIVCTLIVYLFNNATPAIAMALGMFYPLVQYSFSLESSIKE